MTSVEDDVTWLLMTNQMSGLCEEVTPLVACLENIPDDGGVRKQTLQNIQASVANIVYQCELWYKQHPKGLYQIINYNDRQFIKSSEELAIISYTV